MTEELLSRSFVEDGDSEMHIIRDLDLQGTFLTVEEILFRNVLHGWLDTSASLAFLRLQFIGDGFCRRHLLEGITKYCIGEKGLKNGLRWAPQSGSNMIFLKTIFFEIMEFPHPVLQEFLIAKIVSSLNSLIT
jgi:hypothetical protein